MKINMKKMLFSLLLSVILLFCIVSIMAIFVSGPLVKYNKNVNKVMTLITENKEYISIKQDVFRYETYVVETELSFEIFDAKGDFVLRRAKKDLDYNRVLTYVFDTFGLRDVEIDIGYGYTNGVYLVRTNNVTIWIDIDEYIEVFYYEGVW